MLTAPSPNLASSLRLNIDGTFHVAFKLEGNLKIASFPIVAHGMEKIQFCAQAQSAGPSPSQDLLNTGIVRD